MKLVRCINLQDKEGDIAQINKKRPFQTGTDLQIIKIDCPDRKLHTLNELI